LLWPSPLDSSSRTWKEEVDCCSLLMMEICK
jgi:hypothetical protein